MLGELNKFQCVSCGACANACRVGAITMTADDEGFLYPTVDSKKCVDCGKCKKACPIITRPANHGKICNVYAAYNNDLQTLKSSSSGGIYRLIALEILRRGGAVFGVAFDDDFKAKHICVEQEAQLLATQGSKYIPSAVGDCYSRAEKMLKDGRYVLFTGTPCQIAALKTYLGKDYEKLYTQDFICHGVLSPSLFEMYLKYQSECHGNSEVKKVFFRDKTRSWYDFDMRIDFENGQTYLCNHDQDMLFTAFLHNHALRYSCYNCVFKTPKKHSDISLGDYWGIKTAHPEAYNENGTSIVFIQSEKGKELFESVRDHMCCVETDPGLAIGHNLSMIKAYKIPKTRKKLFTQIEKMGFEKAVKKTIHVSFFTKVKNKLKCEYTKLVDKHKSGVKR